jgi:hypothetical protein
VEAVIREGLPIAVGMGVALMLGWTFTKRCLDRIEEETKKEFSKPPYKLPVPTMIPKDVWENEVMLMTPGGVHVGNIEWVLFFAAFWISGGWAVAASWLAFKLASKWDTWKTLGEIPRRGREITVKEPNREIKEQPEHLDDLRSRMYRTSLSHRKFIVGTGANIVWGLVGVGVAQALAIWLRPHGVDI